MNWDAYNKMVAEAAALQDEDAKLAAYNRITDWLNVEDAVLDIRIEASRQRLKIIDQGFMGGLAALLGAAFASLSACYFLGWPDFVVHPAICVAMLGSVVVTSQRLKRSERLEAKAVATYKKEHGYE